MKRALDQKEEQTAAITNDLNRLKDDKNPEIKQLCDHVEELQNVGGERGDLKRHLNGVVHEKDNLNNLLSERDAHINALFEDINKLNKIYLALINIFHLTAVYQIC